MGLVVAEEAVASTMDAAFEEQLKEGAEAFEFQAEVRLSQGTSTLHRDTYPLSSSSRTFPCGIWNTQGHEAVQPDE